MTNAQRSALRALFAASESPADAIRALAAFDLECAGVECDAVGYVQESLAEAALHAETVEFALAAAEVA